MIHIILNFILLTILGTAWYISYKQRKEDTRQATTQFALSLGFYLSTEKKNVVLIFKVTEPSEDLLHKELRIFLCDSEFALLFLLDCDNSEVIHSICIHEHSINGILTEGILKSYVKLLTPKS